jgi:hypothetical protein
LRPNKGASSTVATDGTMFGGYAMPLPHGQRGMELSG